MHTLVPLRSPAPHKWHLMTFESLFHDGVHEIDRLFSYLKEPLPEGIYKKLKKPSLTASSNKNQLSAWKEGLSLRQVNKILNIVELSGLTFYGVDAMPDLEKLNKFSVGMPSI